MNLKLTPKIAGSVIPKNAGIADEIYNERFFLSFVLNATAKAADPCATIPQVIIELNASFRVLDYNSTSKAFSAW